MQYTKWYCILCHTAHLQYSRRSETDVPCNIVFLNLAILDLSNSRGHIFSTRVAKVMSIPLLHLRAIAFAVIPTALPFCKAL